MTHDTKKKKELEYAREFLGDQLSLNITSETSVKNDPPDCSFTVTTSSGVSRLIELELSEFFVDNPTAQRKGSPSSQVKGTWDNILTILDPKLESLRMPIDLTAHFKEPIRLPKRSNSLLANELICFAKTCCPEQHLVPIEYNVFSHLQFPTLYSYIQKITLTRMRDHPVFFWQCSNLGPAMAGSFAAKVKDIITNKNSKEYHWTPESEQCLLIFASGVSNTSRASQHLFDLEVQNDVELASMCRNARFHHIYFWERVQRWYRALRNDTTTSPT